MGVLGASVVVAGVLAVRGNKRRAMDPQKPYYKNYHKPAGFYEAHVKRPLDCYLSSLALVLFSPLLLAASVAVKKNLGSPVLFEQRRPGKDGKIFKLYKFRTMTDEKGTDDKPLPDEDRVTPFGLKLRKSSLDELPELINIAEGDMAIIGPRPLLVKYMPFYNAKEIHRHDVLPGLTGLAQTHGRNSVNWNERFAWDLKYVRRITFLNDVKIIFATVKQLFHTDDVKINYVEDFDVYREKQGVL